MDTTTPTTTLNNKTPLSIGCFCTSDGPYFSELILNQHWVKRKSNGILANTQAFTPSSHNPQSSHSTHTSTHTDQKTNKTTINTTTTIHLNRTTINKHRLNKNFFYFEKPGNIDHNNHTNHIHRTHHIHHTVNLTFSVTLTTSNHCFSATKTTTSLSLNNFTATHLDHQSALTCGCVSTGSLPVADTMSLEVIYPPTITCLRTHAFLDDTNVTIKCHVTSNPPPRDMYWRLEGGGVMMADGGVGGVKGRSLWSSINIAANGSHKVRLVVERVEVADFTNYTLVANNAIDSASLVVPLLRGFKPLPPSSSYSLTERPQLDDSKRKKLQRIISQRHYIRKNKSMLLIKRHSISTISISLTTIFLIWSPSSFLTTSG